MLAVADVKQNFLLKIKIFVGEISKYVLQGYF